MIEYAIVNSVMYHLIKCTNIYIYKYLNVQVEKYVIHTLVYNINSYAALCSINANRLAISGNNIKIV